MIEKIPSLAHLCKQLQQVPYLASKNLYRVAHYFLTEDYEKVAAICDTILKAKTSIVVCPICCMWKEVNKACVVCDDVSRDHSVVCVVETWNELISIERTEGYKGTYHVLGGAISPMEGIGIQDLNVNQLVARLDHDDRIKEIILATNQTPEGETTAMFVARKLKDKVEKISCLARGIPVGSSLSMMDKLTVYKALSDRRPF